MSETFIYINGLCRCCHARGNFRSLGVPYQLENKEEIYGVIIRETFDIIISPQSGQSSALTYTICASCIVSLQDAARFKQQVLSCEEKLAKLLLEDDIKVKIENTEDGVPDGYSSTDGGDFSQTKLKYEFETSTDEAKEEPIQTDATIQKATTVARSQKKRKMKAPENLQDVDSDADWSPKEISQGSTTERRKTEPKDVPCNVCNEKYTFSRLKVHMKIHNDKKKLYICHICKKTFAACKDLVKHIERTYFDGSKYPCNACSDSFSSAKLLRSHLNEHYNNEIVKCDKCDREIKRKRLETHLKIHNKGELKRKHLEKHLKISDETFICDICKKSYNYKQSLLLHLQKHAGVKPYMCDVCGRSFQNKCHMKSHIFVVHSGEKPYKCNFCPKRFSVKRSQDLHETLHTGKRSCVCEICKKSFTTVSVLKVHMMVHSKEKPYSCKICGRKFSQKVNLRIHEIIHTGEKKHVCEVCEQAFRLKIQLESHMRKHTGEKPYSCKICNEKFSWMSMMNTHILRKHNGEKPKKKTCKICNKKLTNIYRHMKIHKDRGEIN